MKTERSQRLRPGDFTGLADDYSENRPDYSSSVLKALLGLLDRPIPDIDFVDVGAGTGIWTRMVYEYGVHSIVAIEPNMAMRLRGMEDSRNYSINWREGSAEYTGLPDQSVDWLSMASSFHWADFDAAAREFFRVLRPGGWFTALWNPRLIEVNPLLVEIEAYLDSLRPNIKRVSSGRSGITESLMDNLDKHPLFEDVIYVEGRHVISMSTDRYLGAWRSVNDLQVQLGPEKFAAFLGFVEKRIDGMKVIKASYLTRAWSAKRKD